jgi:hypothetical protein
MPGELHRITAVAKFYDVKFRRWTSGWIPRLNVCHWTIDNVLAHIFIFIAWLLKIGI